MVCSCRKSTAWTKSKFLLLLAHPSILPGLPSLVPLPTTTSPGPGVDLPSLLPFTPLILLLLTLLTTPSREPMLRPNPPCRPPLSIMGRFGTRAWQIHDISLKPFFSRTCFLIGLASLLFVVCHPKFLYRIWLEETAAVLFKKVVKANKMYMHTVILLSTSCDCQLKNQRHINTWKIHKNCLCGAMMTHTQTQKVKTKPATLSQLVVTLDKAVCMYLSGSAAHTERL